MQSALQIGNNIQWSLAAGQLWVSQYIVEPVPDNFFGIIFLPKSKWNA